MRQTEKVRKFGLSVFFLITVGLPICHVSVILFKMGDNWRLLNRRGAKPYFIKDQNKKQLMLAAK